MHFPPPIHSILLHPLARLIFTDDYISQISLYALLQPPSTGTSRYLLSTRLFLTPSTSYSAHTHAHTHTHTHAHTHKLQAKLQLFVSYYLDSCGEAIFTAWRRSQMSELSQILEAFYYYYYCYHHHHHISLCSDFPAFC
jgi:hypothetical protein